MALLAVIQTGSLVLGLAAFCWAMAILCAKQSRSYLDRQRRLARQSAVALLVSALASEDDLSAAVKRLMDRPLLLAETLLDFMGVVRGHDLDLVLAILKQAGVDRLLRDHASVGKPSARRACLEALIAFPSKESEAVLRRSLAGRCEDSRVLAAQGLVDAGHDLSISALMELTEARRLPNTRRIAQLFRALTQRSPAGTIEALQTTGLSASTRVLLIEALGLAGDYAALPVLIASAADGDDEVRAAAVSGLGALRHPACEPALERALDDTSWKVRARAAAAIAAADLGNLGDGLVKAMNDPIWIVRFEAAQALTQLGDCGIVKLRQVAAAMRGLATSTAATALAERRAA